jgi:peptidoglycan/LPS O-acetylase OafA/YrhL
MRYVRSLDGIRGVAVLLVMLFHYGYFAAGWVGVQMFFTLSGYLITCILLEDRHSSFLAFAGRFYWRRTLRIFPLFYVFLLVVAVVHALSGAPASYPSDWPWLWTYTANFARMRDGDLGRCFVHIWSLAVEEQFYLLWPVLLFFLPLRGFRWVVIGILLLAPVVRLALFQGLLSLGHDAEHAGKAAYVLPFTQFDAFAAGAAIPLWGLDRMRNAGRWFLVTLGVAAVAGVGVLANAHFSYKGAFVASFGYAMYLVQSYGYVWGYSQLNLLSMLGIICALQGIGPTRALKNGLLVGVGKVSYGVYVYHVPLLLVGEFLMERLGIGLTGMVRPAFFVAWLAMVILVSAASFRWLETPFLKLKDNWRRRDGAAVPRVLS